MKAQLIDLVKDGPFRDGQLSVAYGVEQAALHEEEWCSSKSKRFIYAPNPCLLNAEGVELLLPGYSLTVVDPGTDIYLKVTDLETVVKTIVIELPPVPILDEEQQKFLGAPYLIHGNGLNSAVQYELEDRIVIYTDASRERVADLRAGKRSKPGWFTDASKDQPAGIAVARWKKMADKEKQHYHNFTNESFVISKGSAKFDIEGVPVEAPTGSFLYVKRGIAHKLADIGFDANGDYSHLSCQYPAVPMDVKGEKVVVEQ